MPASAAKPSSPLVLICGDDEFAVSQRARQLYQQWTTELGGMDHEIIDGSAANSGEALRTLAKLREALQTLPFFGSGKAVWFQNCNFLGDERAAGAQAVTETLVEVAKELKEFSWENVRLLITAGKVDKRKTFYKTVEKIGIVQNFAAWSVDDKNWAAEAEMTAQRALRARKKEISDEALAELVTCAGINARLLSNEVEKLMVYSGDRPRIEVEDVTAIVTRNKQARAFALGDALGDRDLPRVLRTLGEELWGLQFDKQKSEIGLLYGLITKVRVMLFLKEMLREGWLKADVDYNRFKAQLEHLPADSLPDDKRFNPLSMNPYVLFKSLPHARRYSTAELVRAMDLLLKCNQRLIFSGLDDALILQQTLVQIVHAGDKLERANAA
jgi:DNA polymerase-3 subunit delta